MKRRSSSLKSRTDYRRLKTQRSKAVLLSADHPEAELKHIVNGIVRSGLKVATPKQSISLRLDADVLDWFRSRGSGYQSRINAVLRAYKEAAG